MRAAVEVPTSLTIHESNCQSGGEMDSDSQANTGISQTTSTTYYQKSSFSAEARGSAREVLSAKPSHHSGSQIWAGNFALPMFGWESPAHTNILCLPVVQHSMGGGCQFYLKSTPRIQRTHERYMVIHPTSSEWGENPTEVLDHHHKQICYLSTGFQMQETMLGKNKYLSSICNSHARLWVGWWFNFFFPNCKQHRELNRQQGQKILGWNYRSGNKDKECRVIFSMWSADFKANEEQLWKASCTSGIYREGQIPGKEN